MQSSRPALKILIPAFDFKPALGGVAHYTHELAWALRRRQERLHDVDVRIIGRKILDASHYDASSPFPVVRYSTSDTATLALPAWARAIRLQIREWRPDRILCPLWFPDGAATDLAHLAKSLNIPYALVVHGMEVLPAPLTVKHQVRDKLLSPLRARVFSQAQKIFTVSRYSRDLTLRTTGADPQKVIVVNNGVNLESYKKSQPSESLRRELGAQGPLLLTVTRLQPYKGVDKVLESLPQVLKKHPDLKYVIVGSGSDRTRLEGLVQSLKLQENVIFLGAVSSEKILALYNTADLFVMLSREEGGDVEGFGLVFLEAAACGLPSLGGKSGGIPDAIDDGRSGWLVNPTDVPSIAQTLTELLANDSLRRSASEYGLEMVKNRTWESASERIMEELLG